MRIVLSGQKRFGKTVLEKLIGAGHEVVAVASPLLRENGERDPLTRLALIARIPWIEARTFDADRMPDGVDLIVCAHSHAYIGKLTRQKTRFGAIGYHPSLLPLHRGRDAIQWTIRMRDRVTGGSVYWLNDHVDGGPIAAQRHVLVRAGDTASELWSRDLFPLGVYLLMEVLEDVRSGLIVAVPQDESIATWEPSIGRPPLYRPDLPRIGTIEGMRVETLNLK